MKHRIPETKNSKAHIATFPGDEGSTAKSAASCRVISKKAGNSREQVPVSPLMCSKCGATESTLPSMKQCPTCSTANCACTVASSIFQVFRISSATSGEMIFMGQVSRFGLHLAIAMADAIGLDYQRLLKALVGYHERMKSKPKADSETQPFTRSEFYRLVQKASSTPFRKPSPASRGKSNSPKRDDCTGTNTRPNKSVNTSD